MLTPTYNWTRFWHLVGTDISLADGGYLLYDPAIEWTKRVNPKLVTFDEVKNVPCLVLHGELGIAKS